MLGMDFIPVAPTSVEFQEIPMDPNHFLRKKDKSINPFIVLKVPDWELEFQPWIQWSRRSSSPALSDPTSTDPEFPPGDPQPSQEFQILTPMMEEIRSKAEISQIFNKENSHPDPRLCFQAQENWGTSRNFSLPISFPWECTALPKLFHISGVSGKIPSPGINARATEIVGFALWDEIPAVEPQELLHTSVKIHFPGNSAPGKSPSPTLPSWTHLGMGIPGGTWKTKGKESHEIPDFSQGLFQPEEFRMGGRIQDPREWETRGIPRGVGMCQPWKGLEEPRNVGREWMGFKDGFPWISIHRNRSFSKHRNSCSLFSPQILQKSLPTPKYSRIFAQLIPSKWRVIDALCIPKKLNQDLILKKKKNQDSFLSPTLGKSWESF